MTVFTIEQLRPIKDGMTISRDAKMGQETTVTFFSLGKDTSISQERYDVTAIYIGAKGNAEFLIGENAKKETVTYGDCLIIPGGTLCGVETATGTVYTEIIIKKENDVQMNNIVKSGEVMKLKDLISYEEGSIANLDVVSNGTMKFVLMAFDEGTAESCSLDTLLPNLSLPILIFDHHFNDFFIRLTHTFFSETSDISQCRQIGRASCRERV